MKRIALLIPLMLLASCSGGGITSSTSQKDASSTIPLTLTSVEETTTVESKTTYSEEEATTKGTEITSSEEETSSREEVAVASWKITRDDIEATSQNKYLNDYVFSVNDENANSLSFYGDYIQRGTGEWDGTIQMKKLDGDEYGEIASLFPCTGTISISVKQRIVSYGGEDHDYTGIPAFFVGETADDLELAMETSKEEKGGFIVYTYALDGYFSLIPSSGNAIYLSYIEFVD